MSEYTFVEAFSIPILSKAIEFLFDQGKRILEERRERRLAEKQSQGNIDATNQTIEHLKTNIVITESIKSKEDAATFKIDSTLWSKKEVEVNHLISLLEIHTKNYYLSKEKYAKWGSTMVPNIIVHELEEAEEQIARTIEQLERTLSRVYLDSSTAYSNVSDDEDEFEKGFLDFAVEGYQAFEIIGNTASQLTETTDILGQLLVSNTERLNKLSGPGKTAQAHQIAAASARDLINYASEVDKADLEISNGIPLLSESTSSLIKWIGLEPEGNSSANRESLVSYRESMVSFGASVSGANTKY